MAGKISFVCLILHRVSAAPWPVLLGEQGGAGEQHGGHGEQEAVARGAAATHAFLQLGNFGVKFIWRKTK